MGKNARHEVSCTVCGKKGKVTISKNGRIRKTNWNFFGRFALNTDSYTNLLPKEYTSEAGSEPIEYWECRDCFKHVESILK